MNSEQLTTSKRGALAAWNLEATSDGYESSTPSQLRESLGAAAHEWWRQHATLDHGVQAWRSVIAEAITVTPPPRPSNWPRHLTANGTERARDLLAEFGATVDFLA